VPEEDPEDAWADAEPVDPEEDGAGEAELCAAVLDAPQPARRAAVSAVAETAAINL